MAVTSPLASSNLHISEPCESYATWKKHAYYDDDFKGTAFEFAAMVFETTGGVNNEGLEVLRQLFRFAAKHQGLQLSVTVVEPGRGFPATFSPRSRNSIVPSVAAIEKDIDFLNTF